MIYLAVGTVAPSADFTCRRRWALCLFAALVIASSLAAGQAAAAPRTVRVGVYENAPKIFTDKNGQPAGLFIDLLKKIAVREKWKLQYVSCEWEKCLSELQDGRIDLMPDVAFSAERAKIFDFHKTPVVESWSRIYARPGANISTLSDLNGRRVAVLGGSIQQTVLGREMHGFGFKLKIVPAKSYKEAFQLTADGSADAAITNYFFGDFFYRDYGLSATPIVFNMVDLYYATARGRNADLLQAIDQHLNRWLKQPQSPYYTTLLRWTEKTPSASSVVPSFVYWVIGVIAGLLAAVFGIAFLLRMQVRSRTRHLEQALETQKESEQRYRRLAEEWQTTFDATGDVIWVLDAEQRIVRSNKAAELAFSCSVAEMIGKHNYEIALKSNAPPPGSPFRKMLETRRRESLEMLFGERWFNVTVDPILDEDKNLVGAVNILHDITERKQAEEDRERLETQLFQAQRIEAVGRLAGGVAHDFNNMLSIILGYGELLLAKLQPEDPSRADMEAIVDAGKRSAVLTRALLAFSRQQTLQPEIIDLEVVLRDNEKMLRSLIREDIELKLVSSPDLAQVKVDPSQIEQVIMNLVINARDAMPEGGKLTIETKNVTVDRAYAASHPGMTAGYYVLLAVTDTGSGMGKEVMDRVFEPFFTTKEKGKGTGLGLSTAYGIVKQSSGCIYAYSEPGKGTTFEIYLPEAERRSDAKGGKGREGVRHGRDEHILVVEDEVALRKLLEEMLVSLGYRVTVAAGGNDALLLMEEMETKPDLLLTDVIMPGMDGSVLVERLRQKYPELRVLYMSGYAADPVVREDVLEPGTLFIEKPMNLTTLSTRIREAIGGTVD
jgi:PAS domain S-box-containing protein